MLSTVRMPREWKPIALRELQTNLGSFTSWVLCGGCSVDLVLGTQIRSHADVDIGVFRSEVLSCLHQIGKERVFLCSSPGVQTPWNGKTVPVAVHDIWITDPLREHWSFQIMVFDDEGEKVVYRRDPRIRWLKASHSLTIGDIRVLNPLVTFLYKANNSKMEEKEIMDITALIEAASYQAGRRKLRVDR
jgi:hypothetical protein